MTTVMPPELMSPDQQRERIAELQHQIGREWLRYAITEALVLGLPFIVFLIVFMTTDAIQESVLVPAAIFGGGICAALVLYGVTKRISPLTRQLQALRKYEDSNPAATGR